MADFEIECFCGGGPGGQHRNRTASNVKITHKPTGISACANTKNQHRNRQIALSVVTSRINAMQGAKDHNDHNNKRREQIGDMGRGTRVRTYNFIESRVKDERIKKKFRPQDIMKGKLNLIYDEYSKISKGLRG